MSGSLFEPEGAGGQDRALVARLAIAVFDRGPEPAWNRDQTLFGPWQRYEAEVEDYPALCAAGATPRGATRRLVANHRPMLERRCSGGPAA